VENFAEIAFAIFGFAEFVLRLVVFLVIAIVLIGSMIGLIIFAMMVEPDMEDITDFLSPVLWEKIRSGKAV
jgi:hypothetical protein